MRCCALLGTFFAFAFRVNALLSTSFALLNGETSLS